MQWYEKLFENYGKKYDSEVFVHGTLGECDFIEKEIAFNKEARILDIGCGTGRHSIELTKRDYRVTGIDLSEAQLIRAKEKANELNLEIDFRKEDARYLSFNEEFDLVIMICEGAFPLMETDEMNFLILQGAAKALRSGGKFIFTTLNALFPLFQSVEEFHKSTHQEGTMTAHSHKFDLLTFRETDISEYEDDDGIKHSIECNERYYAPSEITWLMKSLNFHSIGIYAANLGAFSREDKLTSNDFEMLVLAELS